MFVVSIFVMLASSTAVPTPPVPPPQSQWEPTEVETEAMAAGMLGVCETLILPISIIPAVGQYVGLAAEWLCIVPAGLAVENVALHHGSSAPHLWQIFGALAAAKLWQTLIALPVPFVLITAAVVGGSLSAASVYLQLPMPITLALAVTPLTTAYLVSNVLEEEGGHAIFSGIYGTFDRAREGPEHQADQKTSWYGPRVDGIPGFVWLIATAKGADPEFRFAYLIPGIGPILRARAEANLTKMRMRRAGIEVLGERKHDLTGMDAVVDSLSDTKGYLNAAGQAALAVAGVGLVSSLAFWATQDADNATWLGAVGATGAVLAAVFIGLAQVPDALKPCCVPIAYALPPVVEKYDDPRATIEIAPPVANTDAAAPAPKNAP